MNVINCKKTTKSKDRSDTTSRLPNQTKLDEALFENEMKWMMKVVPGRCVRRGWVRMTEDEGESRMEQLVWLMMMACLLVWLSLLSLIRPKLWQWQAQGRAGRVGLECNQNHRIDKFHTKRGREHHSPGVEWSRRVGSLRGQFWFVQKQQHTLPNINKLKLCSRSRSTTFNLNYVHTLRRMFS